jgi:heme exporter protein A
MSLRLTVESVGKSFGTRAVIKRLSFDLQAPGTLGITGPNGSGKTTLLKLLSGLYLPDKGSILIEVDGRKVEPAGYHDYVKMVSPELSLYDMLTAFENLSFFATLAGVRCPRNRQEELLDQVGLAGRGDDRVHTYSSGMKQRLKYAAALLGEPQMLLLDEPTSNLDDNGKAVAQEIMETHRQRAALIIATNETEDLGYAEQVINLGN